MLGLVLERRPPGGLRKFENPICPHCFYYLVPIIFVFLVGCAHVPQASVHLSEELTGMIVSAQKSHLALVEEYISERKKKVDLFMEEKWTPDFMADFLETSGVLGDLERVDAPQKKGEIMLKFAEAASLEITRNRSARMDALREVEQTLKKEVKEHYEDMLMINQALTAHLQAAADVTKTRDELLEKLHIDPKEIISMDKINTSVEKIITFEGDIKKLSGIVSDIKTTISGEI